jgi:Na+/melibiose symporter-like transporter
MVFIMLVVRGGSMTFFMNDYVDRKALFAFLSRLNLVAPADGVLSRGQSVLNLFGLMIQQDRSNVPNVAYAFLGMTGTFFTILGVVLSKPLSERFGKRGTFCGCLALVAIMTMWLLFIPADGVGQMFLEAVAWGICWGPTIPLLWSMIGDSADYSEWKTGRRATGFVFAGVVFALKFGLGIGGFISGMILTLYGYSEDGPLTTGALRGIRHAVTIYPTLFILAAVAILLFYPISQSLNYQIADELAMRRRERKPENGH